MGGARRGIIARRCAINKLSKKSLETIIEVDGQTEKGGAYRFMTFSSPNLRVGLKEKRI